MATTLAACYRPTSLGSGASGADDGVSSTKGNGLYRTTQMLHDFTGDGRPDLVFEGNGGALKIAVNKVDANGANYLDTPKTDWCGPRPERRFYREGAAGWWTWRRVLFEVGEWSQLVLCGLRRAG